MSGIATDLFVHRATRIIQALGLTFPERGVATGGKFHYRDSVESLRKRRYLAWDKAKQRLVNA
jgi:hypothetical protein